jgi:flagellar assembly factor FliW
MTKLHFPEGLLGFEDYTDYELAAAEYEPFLRLQSLQDSALSFWVVDPFIIRADYETDIDDHDLAKIGVTEPADVLVLVILTIPKDGSAVTVNLQGPLIINKRTNTGFQAVLTDPRWTTKHRAVEPC